MTALYVILASIAVVSAYLIYLLLEQGKRNDNELKELKK